MSSRAIRKLPVGEMGRAVREAVRNQQKADPSGGVAPVPFSVHGRDGFTEAMKLLAADFVDRPQTGAAGRGDERYAMVAALYVAQLGGPKPVEAVGKLLHLNTSTARNLLFEARERGLLTSIGRGRAGGELTDKARALLGQAERGE